MTPEQLAKLQKADREALECLLRTLDAAATQLRRDECGDPRILGHAGHIYADGSGFLLCVQTRSARAWGFAKKRLACCRVTQDGNDEGCLALDRMPNAAEAGEIRAVPGIRKRPDLSAETLAASRSRMLAIRGFQAPTSPQAALGDGDGGPGKGEEKIGPSAGTAPVGWPSGVTGTAGP